MYKKIALILSCVLILFISILGIRMVQNIRIKREVLEANKIFNEQNEIYINRDEELGSIEYKSNTMSINILPIKKTNPNINMWEVNIKISSGSQIKSAFADDKFNLRNREKTSNIAKRHNAILAINGAAAGFNKSSYVIRDSIIYRDTRLDCAPLVIQKDGDFRMYDDHLSGEELVERGAMHTYDFGPDLIRGGEIVEYVILVVDGRSEESVGMSLYDTAVELKNRGCYWGYNLDGGGSTTLYFNGEVLNTPSDWNGERKISDILYFVD